MISYHVYKYLHFMGVIGLFLSLGSIAVARRTSSDEKHPLYRSFAITHGLSMFFLLLGGFGMLARLQIHFPWPGWVTVKFLLWIFFGLSIAVLKRRPEWSRVMWAVVLAAGLLASYMGVFKPF